MVICILMEMVEWGDLDGIIMVSWNKIFKIERKWAHFQGKQVIHFSFLSPVSVG